MDAFWGFLKAAADVIAQAINSRQPAPLPEDAVQFANNLVQALPAGDLKSACQALLGSDEFIQCRNYRNCSLHRRTICLKWVEHRPYLTEEYEATTASEPATFEAQFICDDPLTVSPSFAKNKALVATCATTLYGLSGHLHAVSTAIRKAI